jgi:hypothetical protein
MTDSQYLGLIIREALDQGRYALVTALAAIAGQLVDVPAAQRAQDNHRAAREALFSPSLRPAPIAPRNEVTLAPSELDEIARNIRTAQEAEQVRQAKLYPYGTPTWASPGDPDREPIPSTHRDPVYVPNRGATRDEQPDRKPNEPVFGYSDDPYAWTRNADTPAAVRPDETAVMPAPAPGSHAPRTCEALVAVYGSQRLCSQPIQYDTVNRVWLHSDPEITDHDAVSGPAEG